MFRVRFRGSSSKVFLSTLRRQLSISDVDLEWSHIKFNVITYIFAEHKNQRKIVKYGSTFEGENLEKKVFTQNFSIWGTSKTPVQVEICITSKGNVVW